MMRYLILILTLLFGFNVKAETYACAYESIRDVVVINYFERIDNRTFNMTTNDANGELVTRISSIDYEDENWIKLGNMTTLPNFFVDSIHLIQKTGTAYQYIFSMHSEDASTSRGTCTLIP